MRFTALALTTSALSIRFSHSFVTHRPALALPRFIHSSKGTFKRMTSESDEVSKAKAAAAAAHKDGGAPTVFDKILSGEWGSDKVHEDDLCLAFRDINPQAPVHVLVIPKDRDGLTQLKFAREDQKGILGHLMYVAKEIGDKECPSGYRIVVNDGEHGAQSGKSLYLRKKVFCIELNVIFCLYFLQYIISIYMFWVEDNWLGHPDDLVIRDHIHE